MLGVVVVVSAFVASVRSFKVAPFSTSVQMRESRKARENIAPPEVGEGSDLNVEFGHEIDQVRRWLLAAYTGLRELFAFNSSLRRFRRSIFRPCS